MQKTLVIGATGYIGRRIAETFRSHGNEVYGLARSESSKNALLSAGITPIQGSLADDDTLMKQLHEFQTLIFTAMVDFQDEREMIERLLDGFSKPGRTFIFISGSGVVGVPALEGEWNEYTAAEDDPYPFQTVLRNRKIRVETERLILEASKGGLRSLIIRPPLVWGYAGSIQIPQFFESARKTGAVCYLGHGLNLYSHAHVDDVASATYLAFEKGESGNIYHVVAGEVNFRTIAEAVGEVTGCPTRSLNYEEAVQLWGDTWVSIGLAVNSRIRAPKTRAQLGWKPVHLDLVADIRQGSYKIAYEEAKERGSLPRYAWEGQ